MEYVVFEKPKCVEKYTKKVSDYYIINLVMTLIIERK